jgi:hypothetical protein
LSFSIIHPKNRGNYLIAGYRGSEKTSLINKVVNQYDKNKKDKSKKVIIARINFGHNSVLDTRSVLFNIISVLKHEIDICFQKEKSN